MLLNNNDHALYEMYCISCYFIVTYLERLHATDCSHVHPFSRGNISSLVKQKTSEASLMFEKQDISLFNITMTRFIRELYVRMYVFSIDICNYFYSYRHVNTGFK